MTITKRDIDKALENLDDELRRDFLNMTTEEQMTIILSMSGSNSNRLAIVERWQIDFERDNKLYRKIREEKENGKGNDIMTTTQKILEAIEQHEAGKFNWGNYLRDRVLPNIITFAMLALLALIFGQKLINP